jgi:hypothetical protein
VRKPDYYRRVRRAIHKADRYRMKGIAREAFIRAARRRVAQSLVSMESKEVRA